MDLADFRSVAAASRFRTRSLGLAPYPQSKFASHPWLYREYRLLWAVPPMREPLSRSIVFVGEK